MKQRTVIGIEISSGEVRGACVRLQGGLPQLASVARVPVPPDSVDAEGMLNAGEIGDCIRRVCSQLDPKVNEVVIGMSGCSLVARVMEIPPVPNSEVRAVLRGEMDHYRILPAGQSAFDYYRLPDPPGREEGGDAETAPDPVARVLLMGAEERLVAGYRAVVDASHLDLVAVEPGSIAIMRALYPTLRSQRAVATIIVSAAGTDIFITQEGILQFYRRVDTGIPELRSQIGPGDQMPSAAPRPRGGLLIGGDEELNESPPAARVDAIDPYNRQAISLLMTEVQRSLDYFSREFPVGDDSMLVHFSIDAPDATDLFGVMTQYLRSDAEMASVLDHLPVAEEARHSIGGPEGFRYTVAVGLALRGSGGEYADAPALDLGVGDRVIVERRMAPRATLASLAACGFILLGTIVAAFVIGNQTARLNQQLTQDRHALQALTAEHAARVAALERQKNLVATIHERDKPMREAIEFLSAAIGRRACLLNVNIESNGTILLSGEAPTSHVVADVMDTINLSPTLEPIKLNNIMRIAPDLGGQTFHFDMQTGFLKPDAQAISASSGAPKPEDAAKGASRS